MFPPEAILFDWDNTLVDTAEIIHQGINHTLHHFGLAPWTPEETRKYTQNSGREGFPLLFKQDWQEAEHMFYQFYDNHASQYLKVLPGAESLLRTIKTKAIPMGVVSNKRSKILCQEITHFGWQDFFATYIGAGDAARDKPAPDPIWLALERMGKKSGQAVWFVGDAPVDWQAATAAGCWPIPFGLSHQEALNFSQSVANCHELEKILSKS